MSFDVLVDAMVTERMKTVSARAQFRGAEMEFRPAHPSAWTATPPLTRQASRVRSIQCGGN